MSCPDLCTAEKCAELERRIGALEQTVALLEAVFEAHTSQEIPKAHNYVPRPSVATYVNGDILQIFVGVDDRWANDQVSLSYKSNLKIDGSFDSDVLNLTIADGNSFDTAQIPIPVPDPVENVSLDAALSEKILTLTVDVDGISDNVNLDLTQAEDSVAFDIFDTGDGSYEFKLSVNNASDSDTLTLPIPSEPESDGDNNDSSSNLKIDGSFYDDNLTITVADGNSSDTFQVKIPSSTRRGGGGGGDGFDPHIPSNLRGTASYRENELTISIADGESATAFQVEIQSMDDLTKEKIDRIYRILGGDTWSVGGNGAISLEVKPETLIKTVGSQLYADNSSQLTTLTVTNLMELQTVMAAVDFYRSGHHRLPATTLNSLLNTEDGNAELAIYDTFSFTEWMVRQIDALVGEFPLKLRYQTLDDAGTPVDTEMELQNVSEAIAEMMALNLATAQDSDLGINIGMKNLVESRQAANAAITAVDYAAANAEYLGYKGNETKKDVPLSFTPGATTLAETLKPSTKSIKGWKNEDKETLVELIKKTLIGTEIVKASLFHPYQPGGTITGDAIKENLEDKQTADEEKWEAFKNRVNNPSGRYDIPKPKGKIRDLTVDENS